MGNLYEDALPPGTGERFDTLLSHKGLVIERIVSTSKIESQEYVQEQDEWVILLTGEAIATHSIMNDVSQLECTYSGLPVNGLSTHACLKGARGPILLAASRTIARSEASRRR